MINWKHNKANIKVIVRNKDYYYKYLQLVYVNEIELIYAQ